MGKNTRILVKASCSIFNCDHSVLTSEFTSVSLAFTRNVPWSERFPEETYRQKNQYESKWRAAKEGRSIGGVAGWLKAITVWRSPSGWPPVSGSAWCFLSPSAFPKRMPGKTSGNTWGNGSANVSSQWYWPVLKQFVSFKRSLILSLFF